MIKWIDFQIVLAVIDIEIYYKSNASTGGKVVYTLGWYDEGTANAIVRKLRKDGYKVDTEVDDIAGDELYYILTIWK